jgi:hypothetical protein
MTIKGNFSLVAVIAAITVTLCLSSLSRAQRTDSAPVMAQVLNAAATMRQFVLSILILRSADWSLISTLTLSTKVLTWTSVVIGVLFMLRRRNDIL